MSKNPEIPHANDSVPNAIDDLAKLHPIKAGETVVFEQKEMRCRASDLKTCMEFDSAALDLRLLPVAEKNSDAA